MRASPNTRIDAMIGASVRAAIRVFRSRAMLPLFMRSPFARPERPLRGVARAIPGPADLTGIPSSVITNVREISRGLAEAKYTAYPTTVHWRRVLVARRIECDRV